MPISLMKFLNNNFVIYLINIYKNEENEHFYCLVYVLMTFNDNKQFSNLHQQRKFCNICTYIRTNFKKNALFLFYF